MSFLVRVVLPDTPGSLGKLAAAFGSVGVNIESVDAVEQSLDGTVTDDIVVTLPPGVLPDTIFSAALQLPGVDIDSIRPFSGRVDRRGQIILLAAVAEERTSHAKAMQRLVDTLPQSMTSGWAIVLRNDDVMRRVAASSAAPEDDGSAPAHVDIDAARILQPDTESWIPERWTLLDASLCIAPIGKTGLLLVIGRPGGPDFLASEVEHIGSLCTIVGSMLQ
ncbi:ACT domain-containing protein [Corynebacterium epidermidicanis]|uniref:ACT domain-containing protein n=1 Tax=Corynebacterium epidermidicanis TaxID=1050174 RepID=A0A0G3GVN8_9CORY|nr:amino acid-binding ACT domain protein [Corynebacterium epidermidicanis]AKK02927.1 ACT domain-containing protein [Corynebacterium epidermidicanis]